MAIVTICNRCGARLDGSIERQARRHVATLEVSALGGRPERYEMDLCHEHAEEVLTEFTQQPFVDAIEGRR